MPRQSYLPVRDDRALAALFTQFARNIPTYAAAVPDYVETTPLPTAPAVWNYKAIYRLNDELVGQWSAVLSVPLGG